MQPVSFEPKICQVFCGAFVTDAAQDARGILFKDLQIRTPLYKVSPVSSTGRASDMGLACLVKA